MTASFDGQGALSGFSGCNNYIGTYSLSGDQVKITTTPSSSNICDTPIMEQERAYLNALVAGKTFKREGAEVLLMDLDSKPLLTLKQIAP